MNRAFAKLDYERLSTEEYKTVMDGIGAILDYLDEESAYTYYMAPKDRPALVRFNTIIAEKLENKVSTDPVILLEQLGFPEPDVRTILHLVSVDPPVPFIEVHEPIPWQKAS